MVKIASHSPFYKSVTDDQNTFLESMVNEAEIRDAIWDCGSEKSLVQMDTLLLSTKNSGTKSKKMLWLLFKTSSTRAFSHKDVTLLSLH